MFKCQFCGLNSKPGEKQVRKLDIFREVEYIGQERTSRGTEIVQETVIASCCAQVVFLAVMEMKVKQVYSPNHKTYF